ncbi:Hypothetical Protein FCC1311_097512 [Hondaea fermentalgiana]|uniref:VWFA domain-containing protein n=1 Tax=Hondaea fermentalgiana TaxID=2315210 RepID=A0A2R5GUU1_9STRA|nr:Hypothetical Protein FCC1311_097512 [Hondaea fermentalgiana]|eukprot:GBG33528.1 Hypothetical Protein FCC1311_097512 [Hondaea fermentalgiana]
MRTACVVGGVLLALALGSDVANAVSPTLQFDAGTSAPYYCTDDEGAYLSGVFTAAEGRSEQEGLEVCLELFGSAVIKYSYESISEEFSCYLDTSGDLIVLPEGWTYFDGPDERGDIADADASQISTCYDFYAPPTPEPTSSGVVAPAYDAGRTYLGFCTNEEGTVLRGIYTSANGKSEQEGLDTCFDVFGDIVIGYSYEAATNEFSCYFDSVDVPSIPNGWEYFGDPDARAPVAGGSGTPESVCYDFLADPTPQPTPSGMQVPRYDAGEIYAGFCVDRDGLVLSGYFTGTDGKTEQEGLDTCFATFGESVVVGYSFEEPLQEFTCYFDSASLPPLPSGWSSFGSLDARAPVVGGDGSANSVCYNFLLGVTPSPTPFPDSECSAHVVAAVDRTYATDFPKPAIESVKEAYDFVEAVAERLPLSSSLPFGLLDLDRTSTSWRLAIDAEDATDSTLVATTIAEARDGLGAGSRAYGTKFPPVFKGIASKLASLDDAPGFILLVSDGILLKPDNWPIYARLKNKLTSDYGTSAPTFLCFRTEGAINTKFFDSVCDETFYPGMDNKTLAEIATDITEQICTSSLSEIQSSSVRPRGRR